MDGEMLINLFIALIRPHHKFGNVIWSPKLIKDRKIIGRVGKKGSLNWYMNWGIYHMKRDWERSNCLVCITVKAHGDMIAVCKFPPLTH